MNNSKTFSKAKYVYIVDNGGGGQGSSSSEIIGVFTHDEIEKRRNKFESKWYLITRVELNKMYEDGIDNDEE